MSFLRAGASLRFWVYLCFLCFSTRELSQQFGNAASPGFFPVSFRLAFGAISYGMAVTMNIKELFKVCSKCIESYPKGMIELSPEEYPLEGKGFFPVVSGSFHSECLTEEIAPRKFKLMFVGQDWGCKTSLDGLKASTDIANYDISWGTGNNLKELLNDIPIPLEHCFFTNVIFGVREGESNTGKSPAWKDKDFLKKCENALRKQIEIIKPKGIICLGRNAPRMLKNVIPECEKWVGKKFRIIDGENGNGDSVLYPITHPTIKIAAILLHPSFRIQNLHHRKYKESEGEKVEIEILKYVWKIVSK